MNNIKMLKNIIVVVILINILIAACVSSPINNQLQQRDKVIVGTVQKEIKNGM